MWPSALGNYAKSFSAPSSAGSTPEQTWGLECPQKYRHVLTFVVKVCQHRRGRAVRVVGRRASKRAPGRQPAPALVVADRRTERQRAFDEHVRQADEQRAALIAVRVARRGRDQADVALQASIAAARSAGLSWHQVGLATGLSPEGARKRWGGS